MDAPARMTLAQEQQHHQPHADPATAESPAGAPRGPALTVIVPCLNERENIAPLAASLDAALRGWAWELLVVDDDSPDGTAAEVRRLGAADPRIRCLRRIGRRGLSSAVIEGVSAAAAPIVAVMDGDGQHDETILPVLAGLVRDGGCDLAVGSRHVAGGDAAGLASGARRRLSAAGTGISRRLLPATLSDPMSGFFAVRRETVERLAPRLSGTGFKILLDLVLTEPSLRIREVPFRFRPRRAGESKLDVLVLVQFAGLLLDKACRGYLPLRFVAFALVGLSGLAVNLAILALGRRAGLPFATAAGIATVLATASNFWLNNNLTYRAERLRGAALLRGFVLFMIVCGIGSAADIGIAHILYRSNSGWSPAAAAGGAIAVVWNYAVSSTLVWRAR